MKAAAEEDRVGENDQTEREEANGNIENGAVLADFRRVSALAGISPRPGQENATQAAKTRRSASLRGAINAKCKDCVYDPSNGGTWRQQVDACTVAVCPLFGVRPRSATAEEGD